MPAPTTHNYSIRNRARSAILLVLGLWAATTTAALYALMSGHPEWTKIALCWQIFLVPGGLISEMLRIRNIWRGDANELSQAYEATPMVFTGILALLVYYLF